MANVQIMRKEEVKREFVNGLSRRLMLEGSHTDAKIYRCTLKAGECWEPSIYTIDNKIQMFFFINCSGYVATKNRAWNITEQAVFVPNFDKERFWIEAGEKNLEFLHLVGTMNAYDVENYIDYHIITPRFKTYSEGVQYTESFTGNAGSKIKSCFLVEDTACGRWSMGMNKGNGPVFVGEHSHEELQQWSYILPGSDFHFTADGKEFELHEGDLVFIPKGVLHSARAETGKDLNYVWIKLASEGFSIGRDGYPGTER